ncbi:YkgJ family cysteine cluster protein [uncultured Sunxiuqinia sp.]|uniref:YkgJ family cysteine cluster protein n=1 Tax=uncultured Sunxiuqinia sp. TaxID=1573825 RepID=UPI00260FB7CF|nr:YkgJ family cysteine cluster protein [uncultured Sunxiuqinia sp.]
MDRVLSEHEQLFFNDGYQLGQKAAKNGYREEDLFQALKQQYKAIDQLIDSIAMVAKQQDMPIHCQKGCSYCCHQAVFANSYELHYLGHFMQQTLPKEEIQHVYDTARTKNRTTSKLEEQTMLNYKSPCPLLKDNACSVYEARPMACRIYLSTKLSTCREFYQNPENEDNYPALLDFPLMAGRMMNEGFMAALKEKDIEIAEFRMEEGLQNLLAPR